MSVPKPEKGIVGHAAGEELRGGAEENTTVETRCKSQVSVQYERDQSERTLVKRMNGLKVIKMIQPFSLGGEPINTCSVTDAEILRSPDCRPASGTITVRSSELFDSESRTPG